MRRNFKVEVRACITRRYKGGPKAEIRGGVLDCMYRLEMEKTPNVLSRQELQIFLEEFNTHIFFGAWTIYIFVELAYIPNVSFSRGCRLRFAMAKLDDSSGTTNPVIRNHTGPCVSTTWTWG